MRRIRDIIKQEKDFDDQRPLLHLPQILKRDIMLSICKSLFEKVPTLGKASEDRYLRHLICDSLKPVYLNEDTYIIRQGEVLDKMLFINQGTVCTFSTNDENGTGVLRKEQRQYQDVPNNNQVSPAIHRSSHASRKTSVDNADDAESAGADGAEGGED
ncbi:Cyclic nucleotide-gated ion channel 1 [Morella rubra]|uniref:Cyclic nucleotide-gated ion channel 1 n=1 Tax=Morella rubra TaxID=262757 RepID=A0A6A1V0Y3_9ROSI|nr:Cyclic nucleotide-gated ion channel 1 [Morella rubra]